MSDIGLRELRQRASELVRRAEAGEDVTVTVSGRPAARLVPAAGREWRSFDEIQDIFAGPADPDWEADREALDTRLRDPWEDA